MSLTIDNRFLPEELKGQFKKMEKPQAPKPPEGQMIFSLPEPKIDWADGVRKEDVVINGVPGLAITTEGARRDCVLMHIHGGGFTGGSPVSAYRLMDAAKRAYGIDSYSVIYTLVPAAKAPTQVNECIKFYQGLLDMGYKKVIFAGESAGAHLVVTVTLELKKRGLPLPVCVVASSVVADLSGDLKRGSDEDNTVDSTVLAYAGDMDIRDPLISPIFGDYAGFPPLLLQSGELETLKYDAIALGEKIKAVDCDCTLSVWEGGEHAFGIDPGDTWVHRGALKQIIEFMGDKAGIKG